MVIIIGYYNVMMTYTCGWVLAAAVAAEVCRCGDGDDVGARGDAWPDEYELWSRRPPAAPSC